MPVPCQKCKSRNYGYRSCKEGFFLRCGNCGYESMPKKNPDEAMIQWNHEMVLIDRENMQKVKE